MMANIDGVPIAHWSESIKIRLVPHGFASILHNWGDDRFLM